MSIAPSPLPLLLLLLGHPEHHRHVVIDCWPDSCDNIRKQIRGEGRAERNKRSAERRRGGVQKRRNPLATQVVPH